MKNEWMLDVLADLKRFADLNGMPRLATELERVAVVACEEFDQPRGPARRVTVDEGVGRAISGPAVAN